MAEKPRFVVHQSGDAGGEYEVTSHYYKTSAGGSPIHIANYNSLARMDYKVTRGFRLKDYHRRLREGQLMPHTYFKQYEIHLDTLESSYWYQLNTPYYYRWSVPNDWYWDLPSKYPSEGDLESFIPTAKDIYVQAAAARIQSHSWDALTFLAEFGDVVNMFVDIGKRIYKKKLPKNWRDFDNDYLNARYGIRPLIYDIVDIYELVQNFNFKRKRFSERVGDSHKVVESESDLISSGRGFSIGSAMTKTTTISHRGSVTADIDIPKISFNPFVTAWEIVPYSFVVDWFLSLGEAILATSFLVMVKDYTASWGVRIHSVWDFESQDTQHTTYWTQGEVKCITRAEGHLDLRRPCSIPVLPHFKLNLNTLKILDILGLIYQRK